ncbi:Ig domain-containing protein [Cytobacillus sp. Hz8]|uniref:Ig-like domain-containing protein n=1 Tax=Cytobacillus sp. Hz8 TaxID=3347168 RepID=UPI0035D65867
MRKIICLLIPLLLILSACHHPNEDRDVNLTDFVTLSRDIQNQAEIYEVGKPITINYSVTPKSNIQSEVVIPKNKLRPMAVREGYLDGNLNKEVVLYEGPQTDSDNVKFINFNVNNSSDAVKNSIVNGYSDKVSISYLNNEDELFNLLNGNHTGKVREGLEELVRHNNEIILPVVDDFSNSNKPNYIKFAKFGSLKVEQKVNGNGNDNGNGQIRFSATFLGYYSGNTDQYETADLSFEESFPTDFKINPSDITGLEDVSVENNVVKGKLRIRYIERDNEFKAEKDVYHFSIKVTPTKIDNYTLDKSTIQVDNEDLKDTQSFNSLPISVKGIEVSVNSPISMNVGESKQIDVVYNGSLDIIQQKTWKSSDSNIAEVSSDGRIHAKAPGEVTITLRVEHSFGVIEKNIQLSVIRQADRITTNPDSLNLKVGERYSLDQIEVTVGPEDASNKEYKWDQISNQILNLNGDEIVANNSGETDMIVRPINPISSSIFAIVHVKVYLPLDSIYFDHLQMEKGETIHVNSLIKRVPELSQEEIINKKFTVDNKYLATIDSSGKLTAKRLGHVNVTLNAESESGKKLNATLNVDIVEKKDSDSQQNDGDLY